MAVVPCTIRICFGSANLFKSAGFSTSLEKGTCKEQRLVPQLGDDGGTKLMGEVTYGIKAILEFLTGSGPVLNFIFGFGMSNLGPLLEGI